MTKIYVIGHKSPDLDSVAAAISYANLRNKLENTEKYIPAITGEANKETLHALEKFGFDKPESLEDVSGKALILVDHNEFIHAVDGIEKAEIIEILDHHKIDFKYSEPISVKIFPWGSSCSIIFKEYEGNSVEIGKNLAGLMLAAILVDTLITKSPTYTEKDGEIINGLSKISGIDDWKEFGTEIFKVRSDIGGLSAEEIIKSDFKDFNLRAGKFGIGQVETADLSVFEKKEKEILDKLEDMKKSGDYHSVMLLITDIINIGSKMLLSTNDKEKIEESFNVKIENNQAYLEGIVSRKKQVAPKLIRVFGK